MKSLVSLFLLVFVCQFSDAQNEIWQTGIYAEDEWRYISGSSDIPNNWREFDFDDSSWTLGEGGIGYGDNDDSTMIPNVSSLYMRKTFDLSDKTKIVGCLFNADFDDAFVAYLNGVEIARSNINGEFPAWNVDAIVDREAEIYTGGEPLSYFIPESVFESLLQDGDNILSIQTHNKNGLMSSDLTSLYWLSFLVTSPLSEFGEFFDPDIISNETSTLPIVRISTDNGQVYDEPKVDGDIGIVWNEDGSPNSFIASANEYEGSIRIEKKGQSSLGLFPKNSYLFEMVDEDGIDIDTSFLNFPKEEDFILHGPYSDKTLMRNVLIFELANQIGQYATRTRFVELEVNGSYEGIYVMMERIKRDKERVDIAKLRAEDIEGDELTGGYIIKIDKGEADWLSEYNPVNNFESKLRFQYVYPRRDKIQPEQAAYIKSYVDSFERAMFTPTIPVGGKSFTDFIDIESFVDHFLLIELSRDVDAYRFSTYMNKDKDSNGGKLKCGPLWDFNIAFGNGDFCNAWMPQGWMYFVHCGTGNPFWWNKLFTQEEFINHAKCRWQELRQTVFHPDNMFQIIDDKRAELSPALDRNFERWPIIGQYIWPNFYVTSSYSAEINVLKQFIGDRLAWMDGAMFGVCDSTMVSTPDDNLGFTISPNPATDHLNLEFRFRIEGTFSFTIYDELGRVIPHTQQLVGDRNIELDIAHLSKGIYFLKVSGQRGDGEIKKFVVLD